MRSSSRSGSPSTSNNSQANSRIRESSPRERSPLETSRRKSSKKDSIRPDQSRDTRSSSRRRPSERSEASPGWRSRAATRRLRDRSITDQHRWPRSEGGRSRRRTLSRARRERETDMCTISDPNICCLVRLEVEPETEDEYLLSFTYFTCWTAYWNSLSILSRFSLASRPFFCDS